MESKAPNKIEELRIARETSMRRVYMGYLALLSASNAEPRDPEAVKQAETNLAELQAEYDKVVGDYVDTSMEQSLLAPNED